MFLTMGLLGKLAALGTAMTWALAVNFYSLSGKRIGSLATNHYRLLCATCLLTVMHVSFLGTLHIEASGYQLLFIAVSAVLGILVGDTCLIQACMDVGPRIGLLIFNSYPVITVFLAWVILGESLSLYSLLGMTLVLIGILWVIQEKQKPQEGTDHQFFRRGILLAVLAAVCQAVSFVILKPALSGDVGVNPLSVTLLRISISGILIWLITVLQGQFKMVVSKFQDKKAMLQILSGSLIGPFLGMWLLHISLKLIPTGISAVLMATAPIMVLPVVIFVNKEKVSLRAFVGAAVAVGGIGILILLK